MVFFHLQSLTRHQEESPKSWRWSEELTNALHLMMPWSHFPSSVSPNYTQFLCNSRTNKSCNTYGWWFWTNNNTITACRVWYHYFPLTSKGPTNLCNKFFIPHQKRKKEKKVQTKTHQNGHHHGWSRSTLTCLSSDGRTTYRSEPPAAAGKTKKKWKKKTGKLINKYVK